MANVYGVEATMAAAIVKGGDQIERGLRYGNVITVYDYYEAASIAAGTVIYLGPIPLGYRVLPGSVLFTDALGTGVTIKIGDEADDDRYLGATSAATAGTLEFPGIAMINKVPYAMAAQYHILLTTAGADASGTIRMFALCAAA